MQLRIGGQSVYAATGGRAHLVGGPLAVFVHGAGFDHTAFALQSRWLAFRGWNVLAVDLPGHGASPGPALTSIGALADWTLAVIEASGAGQAMLIGHSMGSLVALEAAARRPDRVSSLVLFASAAAMAVHPELLAAARADDHLAIDMVNRWGHGYRAALGESRAPGLWMTGIGERILERAAPGVLYADLTACAAYDGALAAAATIEVPVLLVCGEKDQMTPLKSARTLAARLRGATPLVIAGAGHMMLAQCPDEVIEALAGHLGRVTPAAVTGA